MQLAYCLYGAIVGVIALCGGCLPYPFVIAACCALYGVMLFVGVFAVYNT